MPARCKICDHSAKNDIDRELFGSATLRDIGARYGVSKDALHRHRENHIGPRLARSIARREDVDADKLASWLVGVNEQVLAIMLRAQKEDDLGMALQAVDRHRKGVELIGRLGGFLDGPSVQVVDARSQAVFASLDEATLRRLAYGGDVVDGEATELPEPLALPAPASDAL